MCNEWYRQQGYLNHEAWKKDEPNRMRKSAEEAMAKNKATQKTHTHPCAASLCYVCGDFHCTKNKAGEDGGRTKMQVAAFLKGDSNYLPGSGEPPTPKFSVIQGGKKES